jgi:hypothetical protein
VKDEVKNKNKDSFSNRNDVIFVTSYKHREMLVFLLAENMRLSFASISAK